MKTSAIFSGHGGSCEVGRLWRTWRLFEYFFDTKCSIAEGVDGPAQTKTPIRSAWPGMRWIDKYGLWENDQR
jgi:hypothetical protein